MLNLLLMPPTPKDIFNYIKYLSYECQPKCSALEQSNTAPLYKQIKISKLVMSVRLIMLNH